MSAAAVSSAAVGGAAAPRADGHRAGLRHAVAAEWTKFWSVRSTAWTLAVTVVFVLGICALATDTGHELVIADPTRRSLIGFFLGQLTVGVLGVLVMSAEYGTGLIRATLSATPRRPIVLAAKTIVFGGVILVVGEALAFGAFSLGQSLLSATGRNHAALGDPNVVRAVVGGGLYLVVLGLLALGLATVVRHTAGAIATYAGVVLVLPIIVSALPTSLNDAISRYLPASIGVTLLTTQPRILDTPVFAPWAGFGILCGYTVAVLALGCVLLVRRDA